MGTSHALNRAEGLKHACGLSTPAAGLLVLASRSCHVSHVRTAGATRSIVSQIMASCGAMCFLEQVSSEEYPAEELRCRHAQLILGGCKMALYPNRVLLPGGS